MVDTPSPALATTAEYTDVDFFYTFLRPLATRCGFDVHNVSPRPCRWTYGGRTLQEWSLPSESIAGSRSHPLQLTEVSDCVVGPTVRRIE